MNTEPFETAKGLWDHVLRLAVDHKFTFFGKDAAENARFYGEAQDFMYSPQYTGGSNYPAGPLIAGGYYTAVRHRMSTNLVFNMVEAFLPFLYSKDPVRSCNPRVPKIPDQLVNWLEMYRQQATQRRQMAFSGQMGQSPPWQSQPVNPMMPSARTPMAGIPPKSGAAYQQQGPPPPKSHDISFGSPGQPPPAEADVVTQIRARLLQWVLNATTGIGNLKQNSRDSLVDALVKGRGVLSTELMHWGNFTIPYSRHVDVDDLFVDPDVKHIKDAKWIAVRRREPVWEVEQRYGWPMGSLRANHETYTQEAAINISQTKEYDRQTQGGTCDLIEYYEVFSRMGVGSYLRGAREDLHMYLDGFGPHIRLLISGDQRMPLNLPPWLFFDDASEGMTPEEVNREIADRLAWPIETWRRPGGTPWPVAVLDFHRQLKESWPIAHTTPALAYVKAINWIFTYMMGRIQHAHRTLMCVPKNLEEAIKDALLHGSDLELLEIEKTRPGTMEEIVRMIQIPDAPKEVWNVLGAIQKMFEDSTGVTELLMAGQTSHAFRSAAEANVKEQASQARPSDMANTVEEWQTEAARNEAFAWMQLGELQDVAAIFGEPYQEAGETFIDGEMVPHPPVLGQYTTLWQELVASEDPSQLATYMDFTVESGSAEKKNRQQQIQLATQTLQMLMPQQFQYYSRTGDATPINATIRFWAASAEHPDPDELMFPDMRQQMQQQQQQAQEMAAYNMQHKEAEQRGRLDEQGSPDWHSQLPPELEQMLAQRGGMQPQGAM